MENNKLCNWLLYYSKQDSKVINSEIIIDVENSLLIKQRLCSSICYFECGHILFEEFPHKGTGFEGIFDYLVNDKGNVMDKMKIDEQKSYINKLSDSNNFSIKHHVSIIKCIMKCYACHLAPWDRIKRALDSLGVSVNIEETRPLATFRYVQRNLIIWLKEAATKGLLRLMKKTKEVSELKISAIVDSSSLGSLVLYAMLYYAQTKMVKYSVSVPEIDEFANNNGPRSDLSLNHSRMAILAFAEICDNADILPLQIDCLLSKTLDSVPATLIIALVFHWTFGNSLKNLDNLLRSSYSSTNSTSIYVDKSPSARPSDLPLHNNSHEPKPFFIGNDNNSSNDGLKQIFSKVKVNSAGVTVNGASKHVTEGDTSPEIFLTPTEDEMPTSFINSVTPPIKLLSYKTVDNSPRLINTTNNNNTTFSEPPKLNLKEEFQRKKKEKENLEKLKPKVNIVAANETTWIEQSNKNETLSIPLTPKKGSKPTDTASQNGSSQSLTKGQLNDIQIQLSLRRKKIESDKKNVAQKTEKIQENHRQKAFFQAIDKGADITRRKSLELGKEPSKIDTSDCDRRLSLYNARTDKNPSPVKRLLKKDVLESFIESPVSDTMKVDEKGSVISPRDEIDSSRSPNTAEVGLSPLDLSPDKVSGDKHEEVSSRSLLRKNSSPSISSLSSSSDLSADKGHVTKDEYQKSIDLLSTSLTSLQEEIRFLSQQQLSWNNKVSQPLNNTDSKPDIGLRQQNVGKKVKSVSNSVAETPTNNAVSLTEISDTTKPTTPMNLSLKHDQLLQRVFSAPAKESRSDDRMSGVVSPPCDNSPKECHARAEVCLGTEPHINMSPGSEKSSPDYIVREYKFADSSRRESSNRTQSIDRVDDNIEVLSVSIHEPSTEDEAADMSSSSESGKVTNAQPVSFVIAEDKNNEEALRKKAELLAKREQRRLMKLEMFRQRREQDRENRLSAANEELMERELKKKLEQEKRDSLLKKYLDRRHEESAPDSVPRRSASNAGTPVRSITKSQTLRPSVKKVKQDSVEDLTLASPQRNGWFSSMRQNHRMTSISTSQLDTNIGMSDSLKFGVPLPPQEYMGPKLFGKRKVKTNRSVIANAIAHCCLAGSVNIPMKESVLKDLASAEGTHFMILFRDARCQYRSLYLFDLNTEELNLITGTGPKRVTHDMVEKFYKYNSGAKQFNPILSTKHLSPAVDAICIQSVHWNTRPTGQILTGAVSTSSISQTKNKRLV